MGFAPFVVGSASYALLRSPEAQCLIVVFWGEISDLDAQPLSYAYLPLFDKGAVAHLMTRCGHFGRSEVMRDDDNSDLLFLHDLFE